MKIAILGGTGKEGSGLGFRWAAAGHEVIIGSRSEEKGIQAAAELQAALPDGVIRGCDNVTAADEAEIVVLSVPYEAQQQLGRGVTVVAAFQNISATHLRDLAHELDCDVLICGEKAADKDVVAGLCRDAGMRGINAGALANAVVAEGLTAVLLGINVRHKISGAGIRITGLPAE